MDIHKHEKICEAYWSIREQVRQDPEYAHMRDELEKLEPLYEAVLQKLPAEDRELMARYLLLRESLNSRTLEWACGERLLTE